MNISTEHILQCNQSEPLADASGRIVDLMNENGLIRRQPAPTCGLTVGPVTGDQTYYCRSGCGGIPQV